jgi:hypothetical protein
MKHFFYAVYVLFYTGAVVMAGMFVGQFLEKARAAREKTSEATMGPKPGIATGDRKVAMMRKRE